MRPVLPHTISFRDIPLGQAPSESAGIHARTAGSFQGARPPEFHGPGGRL